MLAVLDRLLMANAMYTLGEVKHHCIYTVGCNVVLHSVNLRSLYKMCAFDMPCHNLHVVLVHFDQLLCAFCCCFYTTSEQNVSISAEVQRERYH